MEPQPSPASPSAPQVIEKMERVLEDKLQERNAPPPNRLPGKPSRGEAAPRGAIQSLQSLPPRASQV